MTAQEKLREFKNRFKGKAERKAAVASDEFRTLARAAKDEAKKSKDLICVGHCNGHQHCHAHCLAHCPGGHGDQT